ncbi:hypothetical protein V496_05260 [Pseudogymnoascus sp. VKM F-4515 (FW-2607)]|nr:hypothetical protein V496_05260 [Pseudogymnoascus sp. VKM F-4515 (FW-2607)]
MDPISKPVLGDTNLFLMIQVEYWYCKLGAIAPTFNPSQRPLPSPASDCIPSKSIRLILPHKPQPRQPRPR